ncbi:MAG: nicotinate (nicotinamide) nucleotide adenylyltransferase [Bacteroidia bacterium]|jgi:nicotinate-nucleotide adenylyltransferase|nr:nicotinate (nicotinamide) nucleotide adenylyltransferase [Bacteroidia bacterium]
MKIGLFFGSFNPIHIGHQIIAQTVLNETALDYVWLIVSPHNPLKEKRNLIGEYDRLKMAELAFEGNDRILASNVEFTLPRPSYTIDTLTHLADKYRSYEFSLIMGQDNLLYLDRWKKYEVILKYYPLYVYPRSGQGATPFDTHPAVHTFEAPLLDISATRIRQLVQEQKSIRYLVSEPVRTYIEQSALFK